MSKLRYGHQEPVATHLVLLAKVWDISEGDVCELGTGYFSTLLLHWLATTYRRHVYSFESKGYWYNRARRHSNEFHHIVKCETWEQAEIERPWGMAFVDHSPGHRRPAEVIRLADYAGYIVIHDTQAEEDGKYHFSEAWPAFRYRYDYTKILPWTSVVSNFHDLSEFR